MSSPLLKHSIKNAKCLIINICGDSSLSLGQVIDAINDEINPYVSETTNIILGTSVDPTLNNRAVTTIIATGFTK